MDRGGFHEAGPAWAASLVTIAGCGDFASGNFGFDGTSYVADYPDGNPNHPTGFFFTSPHTGSAYDVAYSCPGFESNTPRIEDPDAKPYNSCDRFGTGAGCTRVARAVHRCRGEPTRLPLQRLPARHGQPLLTCWMAARRERCRDGPSTRPGRLPRRWRPRSTS
jgi:hypothetical protein